MPWLSLAPALAGKPERAKRSVPHLYRQTDPDSPEKMTLNRHYDRQIYGRTGAWIDAFQPGDGLVDGKIPGDVSFTRDWNVDIPGEGEAVNVSIRRSHFPYAGYRGENLWINHGKWRLVDVGGFQKREDLPILNRYHRIARALFKNRPLFLELTPRLREAVVRMDRILGEVRSAVTRKYQREKKKFPAEMLERLDWAMRTEIADKANVFALFKGAPGDFEHFGYGEDVERSLAATISLVRWNAHNFAIPSAIAQDFRFVHKPRPFLPHFAWNLRQDSPVVLAELARKHDYKIAEVTQNVVFKKDTPEVLKHAMLLKVLEAAEDPTEPLGLLVFAWNDYMIRLFRRAFPLVHFTELVPELRIGETKESEHLMSLEVSADPRSDFQVLKAELIRSVTESGLKRKPVRGTNPGEWSGR
jgi:hypothetical protein